MKSKTAPTHQLRGLVKYETVLWIVIVTVSVLAIVDRFTTNFWPRQSFRIGAGSAGNDRMNGFKEGPWSVVVYDIVARVSGRFSIVAFNFMLITRLHILEQFIASSWIAKHMLDCSNIIRSNLEAHKWTGIALCVLTLVHVWSILLPCLTHRWKAQVVPGYFEWPLSERTPPGFKDANPDTQTMSLQVDDVFRMVEMTLLLAVLVPLSIRWMNRCWHLGIQVHRFIAVLYFVDIVRRHSHPHSWVLNIPVFAIWILDKALTMVWRMIQKPIITRESISPDYIVLYWKSNINLNSISDASVGSKYFMKLQTSSWMEPRHPFTTFKYRKTGQKKEYTSGAVLRVFRESRKPRIGGEPESRSHTERIAKEDLSSLAIWGPFQGNVSRVLPETLLSSDPRHDSRKNLVMVGSGSAVNFMIDLLLYLQYNNNFCALRSDLKEIILLFSTRDTELHNWVNNQMVSLLTSIDESSNDSVIKKTNVRIILACTSNKGKQKDGTFETVDTMYSSSSNVDDESDEERSYSPDSFEDDVEIEKTNRFNTGSIEISNQRIDYEKYIPSESEVFCQGSSGPKSAVLASCRKKENIKVYFD